MSFRSEHKVIPLIPMSLAKTGIAVTIVAFSSYLVAELKYNLWSPDIISFIVGSTAIFELIRFVFARLSDKYNKSQPFFTFGFLLGAVGIAIIPEFLLPADNILMIIPMILFYMGSAIMSTLIDSHLIAISKDEDKSSVATVIQITRLSGFAIGGIIGARLYATKGENNELDFAGDFFKSFTYIILLIFVVTSLSTLLTMKDDHRVIDTRSEFNFQGVKEDVLSPTSQLMLLFLFLYPIGLFMQDHILESYSIERLDFKPSGVGTLVIIWASLTLVFAPIGNVLAKKTNKLKTLIVGQTVGTIGLLIIAGAGLLLNTNLLYFGVVLFGIGSGTFSVPGFTYMLDIVALHKRNLAIMLSVFGMMLTISRSIAATLAGIILRYTDDNYELVFFIEAIFFLVSMVPIIKLEKIMGKIN